MTATVNGYIHGTARYQVIAPVVVAQLLNGAEKYIYRGGLLPASTLPSHVEHLVDAGMVRELEQATS